MKNLLGCAEILTLVHRECAGDNDVYTCYPINGASWYEKMETAVSADGAKPVNVVKVRIPEAALPACLPHKLDYIVKGQIEAVNRPGGLTSLTYFQVTAISDNRRGSLPHVMVSGT